MTRLNGGRQLRIPNEAGYDGELFEVGVTGYFDPERNVVGRCQPVCSARN